MLFIASLHVTLLTPLSRAAGDRASPRKKIKTPGYATVRHLSTCIMYCSAHAGSNAGGGGSSGEGGGGCQGRWEEEEEEEAFLLLLTLLH